jgi:flagellar biosynthetic protein FliQ
MSPVIDKIYTDAYQPFSEDKISMQDALEKGAQPLREFMLRQTREADLAFFARLANTGELQGPEAVPMRILLPAYVTSELKTAFQIGFTIFIPFLIIDLVIASVLMALGMMMVPPQPLPCPLRSCSLCLMAGNCWSARWRRVSTVKVRAMTPESVMMMGTEAMKVAIAVAAPLLLVSLVTGLIISILQAATQINEMTLSFIPKIIAVFVAIIVAGPWMLNLLLDYMRNLFTNLPYIIG